ncbi:hypothetical protein VTK26DRAFT_5377 [Humicola hyalothermophila]
MSQSPPSSDLRQHLLRSATAFCNAMAEQAPRDQILSLFTRDRPSIRVLEHGLPGQEAPFIGRQFRGVEGLDEYMELLLPEYLTYKDMSFDEYLVDGEKRKVTARGSGRFTWKETEQSWSEQIVYILAFDDEHKVTTWEIWADSGALVLAKMGKLRSED